MQEDDGSLSMNPLVQLTLARVREFVREPEAVFWVFVFPVLLAFVLGIAFRNTAPQKLLIAVERGDDPVPAAGAASTSEPVTSQVADALSRYPGLQGVTMTREEAINALRTGRVAIVVRADVVPPSGQPSGKVATSSSSPAGSPASVHPAADAGSSAIDPVFNYEYDPTRPESQVARLQVDDALQRAFGRADVATVHDEKFLQPGARYIDFLIPGLIGLNLMGSGMWGLGFAIVTARTRKLLKRFAATPMRRSQYLLSFMLSRLVFLVLEVAAVVVFGWLVFGVSVHGSILSLVLVALVGALSFAGLGLLVAARPRTVEGVSGMMNLVMLPMWLLSGTFFSYSRFPGFLQPVIRALPLTALNDSLRSVMNDGSSLFVNWAPITVLVVWGLISFVLAMRL
ncbi:MAG TPA: ABC transporter permease, partial [Blastocatellia bacterium]